MKPRQCSIRPLGQRSITTLFLSRASKELGDCNKPAMEIKLPTRKSSTLSLSDFLNRKLHKSSVLPTSVPGKHVAFSSPTTAGVGETRVEIGGDAKTTPSLDDGVFHMFKNVDKHLPGSNSNDEIGNIGLNDSRKRKNVSGDYDDHKPSGRTFMAVLGEDSESKRCRKRKEFARKEEHGPFFNHYKNGGGWWDENMEGLDNEEVGCKDAWEGVGCATLGAFEWH